MANTCLKLLHLSYLAHKRGFKEDSQNFLQAAFDDPRADETLELLSDMAEVHDTQSTMDVPPMQEVPQGPEVCCAALDNPNGGIIAATIQTTLNSRPRSDLSAIVNDCINILGCTPEAVVEVWNNFINNGRIVKDGVIYRWV